MAKAVPLVRAITRMQDQKWDFQGDSYNWVVSRFSGLGKLYRFFVAILYSQFNL